MVTDLNVLIVAEFINWRVPWGTTKNGNVAKSHSLSAHFALIKPNRRCIWRDIWKGCIKRSIIRLLKSKEDWKMRIPSAIDFLILLVLRRYFLGLDFCVFIILFLSFCYLFFILSSRIMHCFIYSYKYIWKVKLFKKNSLRGILSKGFSMKWWINIKW